MRRHTDGVTRQRPAVLCYVHMETTYGVAYFTTQKLSEQWGDDWNDRPYEHNAGTPYAWREGDTREPWHIEIVRFTADLQTPCAGYLNSPYSVEDINRKTVPWLVGDADGVPVHIMAGSYVGAFKALIRACGGVVLIPEDPPHHDHREEHVG